MHPNRRGFESFYGFIGGAHGYFEGNGILRNVMPAGDTTYTTDDFAREAEAFIARHDGRPWFLLLTFNAVHTPMDATEERLARFAGIADPQRRKYAAMLSAMDDAIGRVQAAIAARGATNDTLVGFISDNGGPTMRGTTTNGSSNAPLRGSKRTTLEGGIRVPFLLSWPGRIEPAVDDRPVIQLDLHATALAAAGMKTQPEWKLDGVDLLPYLVGDKKGVRPHESLFWRFGEQMAVRHGDLKLVRYDTNAEAQSGRTEPVSPVRLYDLAADIGETKDLAAEQPEKVKELQAIWDAWNAENRDPLWGGRARRAAQAIR
jgi:arylsulfatase A-like enzyme